MLARVVSVVPPRLGRWDFRAEPTQQANRCEVIVVVAFIITMTSTIVELHIEWPRRKETAAFCVVVQHERNAVRGHSHDAVGCAEVVVDFFYTALRRLEGVRVRMGREVSACGGRAYRSIHRKLDRHGRNARDASKAA